MRSLFTLLLVFSMLGRINADDQQTDVIFEIHEVYTKQIDVMKSDDTMIVTLPDVFECFASSISYIVKGRKYDPGNGIYWGGDRFDLEGKLYTVPRVGRGVGITKIETPAARQRLLTLSFDPGFFADFEKPGGMFAKVLEVDVIQNQSTALIDLEKLTVKFSKKLHVFLKLKESRRAEFENYLRTLH